VTEILAVLRIQPGAVHPHVVAECAAYVVHSFHGSAITSATAYREAPWRCLRSGT
jgi:hypothetical protein